MSTVISKCLCSMCLRLSLRLIFLSWLLIFRMSSIIATTAQAVDIERLLDTMGWEGQIGQMAQIDIGVLLNDDKTGLDLVKVEHYIGELGIGSVLNNVPWNDLGHEHFWKAPDFREAVMQIQHTAQQYGRPPVIWGLDSVHGANYIYDTVITPQPLNLAATFNISTAYRAGLWASQDTRKAGIPWLFSPLLGLSWNSFWSRTYETFGEDPLLVGDMAQAMIQGIQHVDDRDTITPSRAAACGKHWLGYSFPHNGHDRSPSWIPRRHLYQYFLKPWQKVLRSSSAPLLTIMESYTETDGVPNVANRQALFTILRQQLDFKGMLVTDYHEIFNLYEWHHTADSRSHALYQSISEGTVDMSMIAYEPEDFIDGMLALDRTTFQKRIRDSARRVLELKQVLNMFEESFELRPLRFDSKENNTEVKTSIPEADLQAALVMTQESIVLAKNNENTLPLDLNAPLNILVTGPTSTSLSFQSGGWTGQWQGVDSNLEDHWFTYGSTVLGAFQEEATTQSKWQVTYQCGVDILGNDCEFEGDSDENFLQTVEGWVGWKDKNLKGIENAMKKARDANVVVICLGEENYTEKPGDIRDLRLPQGQYELVSAIKQASPDTIIILVYFGGRPRLLADVVPEVDAVLLGFLPGPLAGNAIVDIISGRYNPSARLPITYPKYQDLGGVPYLHAVSDKCTENTGDVLPHWNNIPCEVQWPFGYGLSYSQFSYEDIRINTNILQHRWNSKVETELQINVIVTNIGNVAGSDSVLFFIFDEFRSTTPEYKQLKAYQKIWLSPGDSTEVSVSILLDDLRFVGPHEDTHYILQDGLVFRVGVGAEVDCRVAPDDDHCSDPVTIRTEKDYVAACEAACQVWDQSGCDTFTSESCRKECSSDKSQNSAAHGIEVANEGWGWTYVTCLESFVRKEGWDSSGCWKMTTFCRDVLKSSGMKKFENGTSSKTFSPHGTSLAATAMSLFAGLFAAMMIYLAINGRFTPKERHQHANAQFHPVATIKFA
ncbi:beta-glucosidase [Nitzschia inconspicua]|uniref:beta-glucosidase n=1 Tax=Nitzschia inconspicua TaxID=303405 RepID=A0A9K3KJY0_9STRA|nr:beta-glucosidase [Nitzschia inconspicua]